MRQNPHVRICGGPGSATTLVYPTATSDNDSAVRAAMAVDVSMDWAVLGGPKRGDYALVRGQGAHGAPWPRSGVLGVPTERPRGAWGEAPSKNETGG